jgi:hypothetical protein
VIPQTGELSKPRPAGTPGRTGLRGSGRAGRLAGAVAFGLKDREAPVVALAGFLVRGGIVVLALPAVVLPSVFGLAEVTGVRAISIAGQPTTWLLEALFVAGVGLAVWLAVAGIVGAVTDVWLVEMALETDEPRSGRLVVPGRSLVLRLVAIRAICAVPLAITLVWAAGRIFDVTYAELITPTDLAQPLPLRVLFATASVAAVVAFVWLAGETYAAIAIRREILAGGGIWRSLRGTAGEIVRRPLSTLLAVVPSYAASLFAAGLALLATATAFDWCRMAARNATPIALRLGIGSLSTNRDFRPVVFAFSAGAMALAWAAALALSGVTSAWRNAAFSIEVADALAARSPAPAGAGDRAGLGLSGAAADRSGD